jgi:hypothetical protein
VEYELITKRLFKKKKLKNRGLCGGKFPTIAENRGK